MYKQLKQNIPFILLLALISGISLLYQLIDRKHIEQHQFTVVSKNNDVLYKVLAVTQKNIAVDPGEYFYLKDYIFTGDTGLIKGFVHRFRNREDFIPVQQLVQRDSGIIFNSIDDAVARPVKVFSLKNALQVTFSRLPVFHSFLNWKGDRLLLKQVLLNPLLLFFILFAFIYRFLKKRKWTHSIHSSHPVCTKDISILWIWLPFLTIFLLIFYTDHYYFLQDDNYAQFTPTLIQGLDGWYRNGSFPTYNPLQLGGVPTVEYSTYSFLYPITHFSYWVAKTFLHNKWQFNNCFAVFHFAIGYFYFFRICRHFTVSFGVSMLGALCFIFCGFNLEASRSWYYVAPTIAFLPMLLYFILQKGAQQYTLKNYLFFIMLLTVYAYSGNFQYWLYTLIFLLLVSVSVCQNKIRQFFIQWAIVLAAVALLYAPQLLVTYFSIHTLNRTGGEGQGIWGGIGSFCFPFFYNDALPNGWGGEAYRMVSGYFYHGGFFFVLALLLFTGFWVMRHHAIQQWFAENKRLRMFILLSLLALLLATGRPALLWILQSRLPLFDQFNHPFKFFLYLQFFAICSGVMITNNFLNKFASKKTALFFYLFSLLLLIFQVSKTKDAFFVYTLKGKPYEPPKYASLLGPNRNYRILSLSPSRSADSLFAGSLTLNFAGVQEIASIDGYEPFFQNKFNLYTQHRQAGVRYFILGKYKPAGEYFTGLQQQLPLFSDYKSFRKIYEDDQVSVMEDTAFEPIVQFFDAGHVLQQTSFTMENRNNGAIIKLNKAIRTDKILLGFNYHKNLEIFINRKNREFTNDPWNRIAIDVKDTVRDIEIRYNPLKYL